MNHVAQIEPKTAETQLPAALTPMQLIERALMNGADMALIDKFMEMQERWDTRNARKAFDEAIAAAKAEIKPIHRNATGHNSKKYADFAAIAEAIDPILSKHGLHYRFRTMQNERISVTCILSHKAGHSEETTLSGPADQTGNKNAIQAIGSTQTYLQRYTLVSMLGLAASNDDDGKAAGAGECVTLEQVGELIALADEVGADKEAFCRYFKVDGFADIKIRDFDRAKAALNKKRSAK
jgi:hypothetical protein